MPVTSWPAATSNVVNGRPIAPLAPARKIRVTVEKTTSNERTWETGRSAPRIDARDAPLGTIS